MAIKKPAKLAKTTKFYGSIEKAEKQDDGTMIVMGFASSEAVDSDGEIIKAEAIRDAIPAYMKFANVREMHKSDSAVGTVLEMETQDDGRTWVKTHIVDVEACRKVEHKVFKGFSIGGRVTARDETEKHIIKGIQLSEISLVDRPANPEAVFTFAKAEGATLTDEEVAALDAEKEKSTDTADGETSGADESGSEDATGTGDAGEISADGDKDATGEKEAADKVTIKKGMWGVSCFANILSSIQSLQESAEWEAEAEGDASTMPAELMAWLKQGGTLLSAMVSEEVAEMTASDEVSVEVIALGERATTLIKAAWSAEDADAFVKAWHTKRSPIEFVFKSGARNSSADQKHIDAIHSASMALGATCESSKAEASEDLQKAAKATDSIAKMLEVVEGDDVVSKVQTLVDVSEALAKRVKALEALPAAPKGAVRAVNKSADTGIAADTADDEVIKIDSPESAKAALKKNWARGGQPL